MAHRENTTIDINFLSFYYFESIAPLWIRYIYFFQAIHVSQLFRDEQVESIDDLEGMLHSISPELDGIVSGKVFICRNGLEKLLIELKYFFRINVQLFIFLNTPETNCLSDRVKKTSDIQNWRKEQGFVLNYIFVQCCDRKLLIRSNLIFVLILNVNDCILLYDHIFYSFLVGQATLF